MYRWIAEAISVEAMPPKSVGAARRARKAQAKEALQEQGQAHPGYVADPCRPRRAREGRAMRAAVRTLDARVGAESDTAVLRRPAGNQPSHYAKAKARSAVEACPPQREEAASSAVEACPPQRRASWLAHRKLAAIIATPGAPSGSGVPIETPTEPTTTPGSPLGSGAPIEIPILCQFPANHRVVVLSIGGNISEVCACDRGRSANPELLSLARLAALGSLLPASGGRQYVVAWRNPSDSASWVASSELSQPAQIECRPAIAGNPAESASTVEVVPAEPLPNSASKGIHPAWSATLPSGCADQIEGR